MSNIDLTKLPAPDIIESLLYESILADLRNELQEKLPSFTALLESDPAIKILEVVAWRELLLRTRINEAARSNLLAFAGKGDLEQLAAFYNVIRLNGESDEALRLRTQAKIMSWSTAGSEAHYRYHALTADPRVRDARIHSPVPGKVRVAILSKEESGIATPSLLNAVRVVVASDSIRVLTDTVEVVAATIIPVSVQAKVTLYPPTTAEIITVMEEQFKVKLEQTRGLGWDLTCSWITAHLFAEGVQRIELVTPLADIVVTEDACVALENLTLELTERNL